MTHLVDEKRLEEFERLIGKGEPLLIHTHEIKDMVEALSLALAVVRAGQKVSVCQEYKGAEIYALEIALAPFSPPRSDAGTQGEQ